ncbi:MAG TPA: bifunctional DNA primase/polymerase [Pyrinomonadaceae bacterium]|jgi:hypothetical protein
MTPLISDVSSSNAEKAEQQNSDAKHVLGGHLPKKIRPRLIELADKLYDYIPPVCWMTEANLAVALGTTRRQIERAKAYLEASGRVRIELRQNGKRANPVHTLIKLLPINQYDSLAGLPWTVDWTVLEDIAAKDLNEMPILDLLEFYQEVRFKTIPLHYPKFKHGLLYCSCKRGRYCRSIGKHPVVAYKSLDFSSWQTYRAMQSYWRADVNYNVGLIVDGYTVLDVDFRTGGQNSLAYLEDELGEVPVGLSVATGNGWHIYLQPDSRLSNDAGAGGFSGIDIRAKGGLVVAPYSVHKSEKPYLWEIVGEPQTLSEDWVMNLQGDDLPILKERGQKRTSVQPEVFIPQKPDANYFIPKGRRNWTLFKYASRERGKGADYDHIYDVISTLNDTYTEPRLKESELKGIASSAMRYPSEAEKRQQGLQDKQR